MPIKRVNPLPAVPCVESPFFRLLFNEQEETAEFMRIAGDLHHKGYAVLDFPDPDFALRADGIIRGVDTPVVDPGKTGNGKLLGSRIQDAWKENEHVRALATNKTILDLLSKLYGRQAWPFQTLNFPMGSEQHFHTDAIHFSSVPERFMCGVWVALEDIGPDQGPLQYFPGTHKWPLYTNEHIGRVPEGGSEATQVLYHNLWQALVEHEGMKHETFCARKGQALIWTANLLHGGMRHNDLTRTRWSQVTHYYFEDCAYYTPMNSDPLRGLVNFREPVNLLTGEKVHNSYNGVPIPQPFIDNAPTGFNAISKDTFDAESYLRLNKDVAESGADPWLHYLLHGRNERRRIW